MTTTDRIQQMQDTIIDLCNTDNDAPRLIREALHDFLMQHLPEAGWYAPQEAEALIDELNDMEKDKTELEGKLEYAESKIDDHEETIDDLKDQIKALTKELD